MKLKLFSLIALLLTFSACQAPAPLGRRVVVCAFGLQQITVTPDMSPSLALGEDGNTVVRFQNPDGAKVELHNATCAVILPPAEVTPEE